MVKVIPLTGHDRPISHVKFNREGDLLFSSSRSKKTSLSVWDVETGELRGRYFGHDGAVTSLDIDYFTTRLLSGSADQTIKVWDASNGKCLRTYELENPINWVNYALGDKKFLAVTAGLMGKKSTIFIYDLSLEDNTPIGSFTAPAESSIKFTQAFWGPLNETIYASTDDGQIHIYDVASGALKEAKTVHSGKINRMQPSTDLSHFITSSEDSYVKLFDTRNFVELKSFETGRPVNDAALFPNSPHIVLSGGQSAETVTTTKLDATQFKLRIYHKIFIEEIAAMSGHFGPVQSLAVNPNGRTFASGGHDGYIRLHYLDDDYFSALSDKVLFPRK